MRMKKYVPIYVKSTYKCTFSIKFDLVFPYSDTHVVSYAHIKWWLLYSGKTLNLRCHLTEMLVIEDLTENKYRT